MCTRFHIKKRKKRAIEMLNFSNQLHLKFTRCVLPQLVYVPSDAVAWNGLSQFILFENLVLKDFWLMRNGSQGYKRLRAPCQKYLLVTVCWHLQWTPMIPIYLFLFVLRDIWQQKPHAVCLSDKGPALLEVFFAAVENGGSEEALLTSVFFWSINASALVHPSSVILYSSCTPYVVI